jgi:hypothetical protein
MRIHLKASSGAESVVDVPAVDHRGKDSIDVRRGVMIPVNSCTDISKNITRSGAPLIP